MARLRNPRKDEYDEIFNFLERIFKYGEIGYNPSNAKKWFDAIDTEDILVMEEDNKIVSHVLMKPYRLYILGSIINGAEVGAVATDERYRGRGFAFTLLNESLQMMAERGYDISTLGGFRDRYARLGWERGGAVCTYVINNRSSRYAGNYKDVLLEKYDPSDDPMRRAINKAYEK
ncbi:MAG: GNAT family N-acetyltransferase, partial [Candidatus Bathyarchaeia archaeon]